MADKQAQGGAEAFNQETGNIPNLCREELAAKIQDARKTKPRKHTLPNRSIIQFYETGSETRQFLRDIALMFSKERSGSHGARNLKLQSNGPAYVTATILSVKQSGKTLLYTIHVAVNNNFDMDDLDFATSLVNFLNHPQNSPMANSEEGALTLTRIATRHCARRFKSYVADAGNDLEAWRKNALRLSYCIKDGLRLQQSAEAMANNWKNPCTTRREETALNKLCKILRACRRITEFRDTSAGPSRSFQIKQVHTIPATADLNVHCEAKLIHACLSDNGERHVFDFIGCSKLPCVRCWYNINIGSPFVTDNTHWTLHRWSAPKSQATIGLKGANKELTEYLDKADPTQPCEPLNPQSPVDKVDDSSPKV